MLLLLLLLGQEGLAQNRVLIDALLSVSHRSAASVCRQSGVQPANLTRFRDTGGEGQISEELQSSLLRSLRWTRGTPDNEKVHIWSVKTSESLLAMEWLLREKLKCKAQLAAVDIKGESTRETAEKVLWVGTLTPDGAPCAISLHCQKTEVKRIAEILMRGEISLPAKTKINLSKRDYDLAFHNKVREGDLAELLIHPTSPAYEAGSEHVLSNELAQIGLTAEAHTNLLLGWLRKQAQDHPVELDKTLSTIEQLNVSGKAYLPKSMTFPQRMRLIRHWAQGEI
ncbi:MAG TPA: hypothetical protein PK497_04970 [Burkholderiaceae bacterium]|nr:hypothetical protein [Burkholderiaceae bacterium]